MRPRAHRPVQWPRVTGVGTQDGLGGHGAVSQTRPGSWDPSQVSSHRRRSCAASRWSHPAPVQPQEPQGACWSP